MVELVLVLGERREDAEAEHEAVEQHVHQHAEADHAEPDHRQHGAPSMSAALLDQLVGQRQRARRRLLAARAAAPARAAAGPRAAASAGTRCRRRTRSRRRTRRRSATSARCRRRSSAHGIGGAQQAVDDVGLAADLRRRTSRRATRRSPTGSHQHPAAQHQRESNRRPRRHCPQRRPATSSSISMPMPTITRNAKNTGATGGRSLGRALPSAAGSRRPRRASGSGCRASARSIS